MNIFVFVKRVPDTESKIKVDNSKNQVIEEGLNFVLSPYYEYAVEEALKLREAHGGKVTVLSVGSNETNVILKKCLAMGADEAVLIQDEKPESYDAMRVGKIIAKLLKSKYTDYHLLLFGKQSMGADNGQVPAIVAELLSLPQVNVVTKLEVQGTKGMAHREIEGASEKVEFDLPAVISAQKGLNDPRYETLKGIMMAKKKEIPVISLQDLGLNEEEIAPQMEVVKMDVPPPREVGKVIDDEPEEAAKKLVAFLREEAKVL